MHRVVIHGWHNGFRTVEHIRHLQTHLKDVPQQVNSFYFGFRDRFNFDIDGFIVFKNKGRNPKKIIGLPCLLIISPQGLQGFFEIQILFKSLNIETGLRRCRGPWVVSCARREP